MARRDGLPTKREMFVDFSADTHSAYVETCEYEFSAPMMPAYHGKPLSAIHACYVRETAEPALSTSVMVEALVIRPISLDDVDILAERRGLSSIEAGRYRRLALALSATAIRTGLRIGLILPPEGIVSVYSTYSEDGGVSKRVNTLTRPPGKISLAGAKYFAGEVAQYASLLSEELLFDEDDEAFYADDDSGDYNDSGEISHQLTLATTPDLPLNNYESTEFLFAYRQQLFEEREEAVRYLQNMTNMNLSGNIAERAAEQLRKIEAAIQRVQYILGHRLRRNPPGLMP